MSRSCGSRCKTTGALSVDAAIAGSIVAACLVTPAQKPRRGPRSPHPWLILPMSATQGCVGQASSTAASGGWPLPGCVTAPLLLVTRRRAMRSPRSLWVSWLNWFWRDGRLSARGRTSKRRTTPLHDRWYTDVYKSAKPREDFNREASNWSFFEIPSEPGENGIQQSIQGRPSLTEKSNSGHYTEILLLTSCHCNPTQFKKWYYITCMPIHFSLANKYFISKNN